MLLLSVMSVNVWMLTTLIFITNLSATSRSENESSSITNYLTGTALKGGFNEKLKLPEM